MDIHLKCFTTLEEREDWQREARFVEGSTEIEKGFPEVPGRKLGVFIADEDEGKNCCLKLSIQDNSGELKPIVLIELPMAGDNGVDLRVLWVEKGFSITNKQLKILADWLCSPASNEPGDVTNSDAIWNWMLWEIDV